MEPTAENRRVLVIGAGQLPPGALMLVFTLSLFFPQRGDRLIRWPCSLADGGS